MRGLVLSVVLFAVAALVPARAQTSCPDGKTFAGACVKGPTLVSWLFKPLQDSFSCSGSVNEALTQFVELQFGMAALGGVLALVVLFMWRRFFRKRAEAKQSAAS